VTTIGADPHALDVLAAEFQRAARVLDAVVERVGRVLHRARWDGHDGDRFAREWQSQHRRRLHESSATCTELSARLSAQAADQRRASGTTAAVPVRAAPHRALGPLPVRTDVYAGQLQASYGPLSATLAGQLTLEHLRSGRVRVTHTDRVGAGGAGSAGSSAAVQSGDGGPAVGASIGGTAQLEASMARQWTVDASAVPLLVAALALEGTGVGLPFRAVDTATQGIDDLLGLVGIHPDLGRMASFPGVPDPDRVEELAGVALAGTGVAGGGPGGLTGSAGTRLMAGTATGSGDRKSLVLEHDASGDTALSAALRSAVGLRGASGGRPTVALSTRVEVPLGGTAADDGGTGGDRPVLVTFRSSDARSELLTRVAIDSRVAGPAAVALTRAVQAAGRGDVGGAVQALGRISIPADAVQVRVSTASVDRQSLALPLSGTGASVNPGGTHVTVTPLSVVHTGD
jgi:hypothetical protein